jgi:hypothetical protein
VCTHYCPHDCLLMVETKAAAGCQEVQVNA